MANKYLLPGIGIIGGVAGGGGVGYGISQATTDLKIQANKDIISSQSTELKLLRIEVERLINLFNRLLVKM